MGLMVRLRVLALMIVSVLAGQAGADERRLALVIGNEAYANLPALSTSVNDANEVARSLRGLGFEVTVLTDAASPVFSAVLDAFAADAAGADAVLFYYSGHAFQAGGINHLVPVAANLDSAEGVAQTWRLNDIAERLRASGGQTLIFLDACRTIPPEAAGQAATAGLAQFDGGAGTFVAFATRPGAMALDSLPGQDNSPFTAALLRHIATPGQGISDLMIAVRNDVEQATGGAQVPWDQSSLRQQFHFAVAAPAQPEVFAGLEVVDSASSVGGVVTRSAGPVALAALAVPPTETVLRPVSPGQAKSGAAAEPLRLSGVAVDGESQRIVGVAPGSQGQVSVTPVAAGAVATPSAAAAATAGAEPVPEDLALAVQTELARLGCYNRALDGDWGPGSRAALRRFFEAKNLRPRDVLGDDSDDPREAVWRHLRAEPDAKVCPEPQQAKAKVPVKPKATAPKTAAAKPKAEKTQKKAEKKAEKPKTGYKAEPKKDGGVKCTFMVVAVVCKGG